MMLCKYKHTMVLFIELTLNYKAILHFQWIILLLELKTIYKWPEWKVELNCILFPKKNTN